MRRLDSPKARYPGQNCRSQVTLQQGRETPRRHMSTYGWRSPAGLRPPASTDLVVESRLARPHQRRRCAAPTLASTTAPAVPGRTSDPAGVLDRLHLEEVGLARESYGHACDDHHSISGPDQTALSGGLGRVLHHLIGVLARAHQERDDARIERGLPQHLWVRARRDDRHTGPGLAA